MTFSVFLKKLLTCLLLPPMGPVGLMLVGIVCVKRRRRIGLWVFSLGCLSLSVLSLPAVAYRLQVPFERMFPPLASNPALAQASVIVVLGAGRARGALEYGGETISATTLERVRYAAQLARRSRLPLLVSGGMPEGGTHSEADLMAQVFKQDYDLTVRWRENRANDTRQNAAYSAELLGKTSMQTLVLVTHVSHMPRAQAAFAAQGLTVIPAAMGYAASTPLTINDFLPSAKALRDSTALLHEYLGNLQFLFTH